MALKGNTKVAATFAAAIVVVGLLAATAYVLFKQVEELSEKRNYTVDLIFSSTTLRRDLTTAESTVRGFSLTGDESFADRYWVKHAGIPAQLEEMRAKSASRPSLSHVTPLAPFTDTLLAQLTQVVALGRAKDAASVAAIFTSVPYKETTTSLENLFDNYVSSEKLVLEVQRGEFDTALKRLLAVIMAICGLALLLPLSFAYQVYQETQRRLKNEAHLETQRLLSLQEGVNKRLQQAHTDLQIIEERLSVTLNSIDDAVIATDADGRVTLLNPHAERLTGWTRKEAFYRSVEEVFNIIHADTREPYPVPVRETLAQGTTLSLGNDTIVIARDGSECDIADSCAPIRDRDGLVVGAVLVFRDVTERKRLDQLLQDNNTELERARTIADKANLAKSEFLSNMSHELRTPLGAILGFTQLMDSAVPPPTDAQKRSIDQILKAGWYLLELINEILDLAIIESGKLPLSMEPVSIIETMRECQAMIEPQAELRGISMTFPQLHENYFVYADRTRVKQILINLLSNAIKYNTHGGTIVVEGSAITPQRIRLSVTDTGLGLSAEKLAQLFQPFNRLGQEASAEEGTGIGLVVCKRLIEMMQGSIGVESTIGKGSTFWFELMLATEPQLAAGAAIPEVVQIYSPPGLGVLTLLYVEDNEANLMLVEDIIARRPGIRLLSARDGISGVKMALASRPDVILMDINLPGISGMQALHMLKNSLSTVRIPVVALSANAMPRDIELGLQAGFFRYLTKPIKVIEFMTTLDTAFDFAKTQADKPNTGERTC